MLSKSGGSFWGAGGREISSGGVSPQLAEGGVLREAAFTPRCPQERSVMNLLALNRCQRSQMPTAGDTGPRGAA